MTGRPQREMPKETVRVAVGDDVYASILPLLNNDKHPFASVSQLVETIIFLSQHIYAAEPDNGFAIDLAKLKSKHVIAQIRDPELARERFLHVTLDVDAVKFIDLLVGKYHMLFRNRSEAVELMLLNVGKSCNTPKGVRYYANRLNEVLGLHPSRKQMGRAR